MQFHGYDRRQCCWSRRPTTQRSASARRRALDHWDTNRNGRISCAEAQRKDWPRGGAGIRCIRICWTPTGMVLSASRDKADCVSNGL